MATISDAKKDQVVKLYQQGVRVAEITKRTGVQRASIFNILRQREVMPNRIGSATTADKESLLVELRAMHETLRQELATKQAIIDELLAHLGQGTKPARPRARV